MKLRKYLSKAEAELLGLKVKPNQIDKNKNRSQARYTISKDEFQRVKVFRELKKTEFKKVKQTFDSKGKLISTVEKRQAKELIDIPDNHEIKRVSTNVSTGNQWVITEPKKAEKK